MALTCRDQAGPGATIQTESWGLLSLPRAGCALPAQSLRCSRTTLTPCVAGRALQDQPEPRTGHHKRWGSGGERGHQPQPVLRAHSSAGWTHRSHSPGWLCSARHQKGSGSFPKPGSEAGERLQLQSSALHSPARQGTMELSSRAASLCLFLKVSNSFSFCWWDAGCLFPQVSL